MWEEEPPVPIEKEVGWDGLLVNELYPQMEHTALPVSD
jgi:hypothetical protein